MYFFLRTSVIFGSKIVVLSNNASKRSTEPSSVALKNS